MPRVVEGVLAFVAILVLFPLLATIGLLVRLHDGGSIVYRGLRVGRHGTLFHLYKFRTMIQDADNAGAAITTSGDTRITPLGRRLRRSKFDELPQLINVLRGEMSFVGPRPEHPAYVALYNSEQREILAYRPGITSPASLAYRHEENMLSAENWEEQYVQVVLPRKLSIDLAYFKRRTWITDMGVLLRTLWGMRQ